MHIKYDELCKVISKTYRSTDKELVRYDDSTQWMLEASRKKLKEGLHSLYATLETLNRVDKAAMETPKRFHIRQVLDDVAAKERKEALALLPEAHAKLRIINTAYFVVASSMHLGKELFAQYEESSLPPVLANASGKWFATRKMHNTYDMLAESMKKGGLPDACAFMSKEAFHANVHYPPIPGDEDVKDVSITGHAIVYAGDTRGGAPILFSLDCKFFPDGTIDGLPSDLKVIMFRPRSVTLTKDVRYWRHRPVRDKE